MAWCQQTFWNFLCKPRPLPLSRSLWWKWHKVSRNPSKLYHGGGQAAVQNQAFPRTQWRWALFQGLVFICVSLPSYSYLLDKKKNWRKFCGFHFQNECYTEKPGMGHSHRSSLCYWLQQKGFSIFQNSKRNITLRYFTPPLIYFIWYIPHLLSFPFTSIVVSNFTEQSSVCEMM